METWSILLNKIDTLVLSSFVNNEHFDTDSQLPS